MSRQIKKIISVILLISVCAIALASCGGSEIKKELCGTWSYDFYAAFTKEHCHRIVKFDKDGTFEMNWINEESPSKSAYHEGTYKISDGKLVIEYNDGSQAPEIEYSYSDGNLRVFDVSGSSTNEYYKH